METMLSGENEVSSNIEPLKLKSIDRIRQIPAIERGYNYAEDLLQQAKSSNKLLNWTITRVEASLKLATLATQPMAYLLEGPILALDNKLCQRLDVVEQKLQIATASPLELKYTFFTKEMMKYVDNLLNQVETYANQHLPQDYYEHVLRNKSNNLEEIVRIMCRAYVVFKKCQIGLIYSGFNEIRDTIEKIIEGLYLIIYISALIPVDPLFALKKYQELSYVDNRNIHAHNLKEFLELTMQDVVLNSKFLLKSMGNKMRRQVSGALRDSLVEIIDLVEKFDIIIIKLLFV